MTEFSMPDAAAQVALRSPPERHAHTGWCSEAASRRALALIQAAGRTGNWRHLPAHLKSPRVRMHPANSREELERRRFADCRFRAEVSTRDHAVHWTFFDNNDALEAGSTTGSLHDINAAFERFKARRRAA
ncbi:MAG TPA: hypothetical protein VNR89_11880 [Roseomonas sp.]|nr:hypothetical protein [Roseomonas sp.]